MAAHIHKGKAGVAGAVIVPLCGPCSRADREGEDLEGRRRRARAGLAYVNVHTEKNPAGEIRGQVKVINHADSTTQRDPGTGPDDHTRPGYPGGAPNYSGRPGSSPTA